MTKNQHRKLVSYWVEGSEYDFAMACDIAKKTKRYIGALFFLHLSTEKILKALFVKKSGEHAPFSHNLLNLADKSGLVLDKKTRDVLAELSDFNLECRYPEEKQQIYQTATKKMISKYIKFASVFREKISEELNK
jgi:HEPN domain-containing protein